MTVNESSCAFVPLPEGCVTARFIKRYKRFSIEAEIEGERFWAHTNNTGAMLGLVRPGSRILLSPALAPGRKLPWTLERVWINDGLKGGFWAGVNTYMPNMMLKFAFLSRQLDFAKGYDFVKMEAQCGNSRLDARFSGNGLPNLWIECKNVSLVEDGIAAFPDAVSNRARKHLYELMERIDAGERGAMFFLAQRKDCCAFAPADYIDPEYARLFYDAISSGVEIYAYGADLDEKGISLGRKLPVLAVEQLFPEL